MRFHIVHVVSCRLVLRQFLQLSLALMACSGKEVGCAGRLDNAICPSIIRVLAAPSFLRRDGIEGQDRFGNAS